MVSDLLQDRFDAEGRVLHLLNHPDTADTPPVGHAREPAQRHRCPGGHHGP